mmetsp:Transcript_12095/g.15835  ORF Transcript_12095/g.15835 Transcript_12095/m.15835 type:complete len:84 (+) Transcript_12095:86-337(+)
MFVQVISFFSSQPTLVLGPCLIKLPCIPASSSSSPSRTAWGLNPRPSDLIYGAFCLDKTKVRIDGLGEFYFLYLDQTHWLFKF